MVRLKHGDGKRGPAQSSPHEITNASAHIAGFDDLVGAKLGRGELPLKNDWSSPASRLPPGLDPSSGLADETAGLAVNASPGLALSARTYADLEARVLNAGEMEGVALRYGFFYGSGTWYHPEGASADQARRQEIPIIGDGGGVWSWVHIEDAVVATADVLTAAPGVYNVVDDDPSPVAVWLPAFARFVGAPPPPRITQEQARASAKLRGASNQKAKKTFGFEPRRLEWLGCSAPGDARSRPRRR